MKYFISNFIVFFKDQKEKQTGNVLAKDKTTEAVNHNSGQVM